VSDHLPECLRIEYIVNRHGYTLTAGSNVCICNALRACEQRVRHGMESLAHLYEQDAYMRGWGEAISAAEGEALSFLLDEETRMPTNWVIRSIAAAIDALAEGK